MVDIERYRWDWLLLSLTMLVGCTPNVSDQTTSDAVQESSLAEQIQACRTGPARAIVVRRETVDEHAFQEILTVRNLETLELFRCTLESISGLEELAELQRLRLEKFACDDLAARQIGRLSRLRVLNLPDARFTDEGLSALAELEHLELLRFGSPNVSDQGIARLAQSKSLRFLHLINVPVTDAGLEAFHGMDRLESFYIDGGAQTDEGIARLIKANPQLHFHRDQLHVPGDPQSDGH